MSNVIKGAGLEGRIYEALKQVADKWLSRKWQVQGSGAILSIDRVLVDANWAQSTEVVYQFCEENALSSILLPSHGRYVGASSLPMGDAKKGIGDKVGLNWRIPGRSRQRRSRYGLFDTNFWKSFVRDRFGTMQGDSGSLSLFGNWMLDLREGGSRIKLQDVDE